MRALFLLQLIAMTCIFFVNIRPIRANPCAAAQFAGRNVLPGGKMSGIHIVDEKITIDATITEGVDKDPYVKAVQVTVDYVFNNRSKPRHVMMGFPIGTYYDPGEKNEPISSFKVTGKGVGSRVNPEVTVMRRLAPRSVLGFCEEGALPLVKLMRNAPKGTKYIRPQKHTIGKYDPELEQVEYLVGWYFWRQHFGKGKSRIRVTYSQNMNPNPCAINYVLRTSQYWGRGRIGRLLITLRQKDAKQFVPFKAEMGSIATLKELRSRPRKKRRAPALIKPTKIDKTHRIMEWTFKNFRPETDLLLHIPGCTSG